MCVDRPGKGPLPAWAWRVEFKGAQRHPPPSARSPSSCSPGQETGEASVTWSSAAPWCPLLRKQPGALLLRGGNQLGAFPVCLFLTVALWDGHYSCLFNQCRKPTSVHLFGKDLSSPYYLPSALLHKCFTSELSVPGKRTFRSAKRKKTVNARTHRMCMCVWPGC